MVCVCGEVSMSAIRLLKTMPGLWPRTARKMGQRSHSDFVGFDGVVGMCCCDV